MFSNQFIQTKYNPFIVIVIQPLQINSYVQSKLLKKGFLQGYSNIKCLPSFLFPVSFVLLPPGVSHMLRDPHNYIISQNCLNTTDDTILSLCIPAMSLIKITLLEKRPSPESKQWIYNACATLVMTSSFLTVN